MSELRLSTAVLLTRGDRVNPDVYLVRRSDRLRFFGGYWAFPGGVIDAEDREHPDDGADRIERRCALRELIEETGIFPRALHHKTTREEREKIRTTLLSSDSSSHLQALVRETPECLEEFRPFALLTTPAMAPVRYRTRFLHFELAAGDVPDIVDGELTDGAFASARGWRQRWLAAELHVVPPVLHLLDLLEARGLDDFLPHAQQRCAESEAGRLHRIRTSPGIVMAPLTSPTLPPATTTNCYIVGEERLFVVDPATYVEEERERLFELLDECLAEGRELAAVVATHHHADHVGSIDAVHRRYGVPVAAHAETLARLPARPREVLELGDGDELDLGRAPDGQRPWRLRIFHTPGHDRGHLAFVDDRYHAALVGDLASTVSTIVIDPPEGHLATYLASLERMLAVPMGMLHPAHGPAVPNGHRVLRHYLAHRRAREVALLEALAGGLAHPAELCASVYADTPRELHALAARSLSAGLDKLEEEGAARRVGERWFLVHDATGREPRDSAGER